VIAPLRGGLVVSCQADARSPLAAPEHIVALARAAVAGGARGVRIEGVTNVVAVRQAVTVPIIGIVKSQQPATAAFITITPAEVNALADAGAEIIAFDATARTRPASIDKLVASIHARGCVAMADISTVGEAEAALAANADFVGTTLSGYTPHSPRLDEPDFDLMRALSSKGLPFVAEGRIWTPEEARHALELGAEFIVVGSAITRPDVITRRFVDAMAAPSLSRKAETSR
jgi:N-acylglucosamine-6-phosphate 2-epimerase